MVYVAGMQGIDTASEWTVRCDSRSCPSEYNGRSMLSNLTHWQRKKSIRGNYPPMALDVRQGILLRQGQRNGVDKGRPSSSRGQSAGAGLQRRPPLQQKVKQEQAAAGRISSHKARASHKGQGAEAMMASWSQGTGAKKNTPPSSSPSRPPTRRRREEDEPAKAAAAARWAAERRREVAAKLQPPSSKDCHHQQRRRERLQKAAANGTAAAAPRFKAVIYRDDDGRNEKVKSSDKKILMGGAMRDRDDLDSDTDTDSDSDESIGSDIDTVGGAPVLVKDRTAGWVKSMRDSPPPPLRQPPMQQLSKPVSRAVAWVSSLWKKKPQQAAASAQSWSPAVVDAAAHKRLNSQPRQRRDSDCESPLPLLLRPSERADAWVAEAQKQHKKVQEDLLYHAMEGDEENSDCESVSVPQEPAERTLAWAADMQRRYQDFQQHARLKQAARQRNLQAHILRVPTFEDAVEVVAPSEASYATDAALAGMSSRYTGLQNHQHGMSQEERQRHLRANISSISSVSDVGAGAPSEASYATDAGLAGMSSRYTGLQEQEQSMEQEERQRYLRAAVMGRQVVVEQDQKRPQPAGSQNGKTTDTKSNKNSGKTRSKAKRGSPHPIPARKYSLLKPDGTRIESGAKAIRLADEASLEGKKCDDRAVRFALPGKFVQDSAVSPLPTPLTPPTSGDETICAVDETFVENWKAEDLIVHFVLTDEGEIETVTPPTPAPAQVEQRSTVGSEQRAERTVSREMKLLMERINVDLADSTAVQSQAFKESLNRDQ